MEQNPFRIRPTYMVQKYENLACARGKKYGTTSKYAV
jgi:hypothetical protein